MKNSIRSYNRSSSCSSNRSGHNRSNGCSKVRGSVVTQVAAVVSRSSEVGGRVVTGLVKQVKENVEEQHQE